MKRILYFKYNDDVTSFEGDPQEQVKFKKDNQHLQEIGADEFDKIKQGKRKDIIKNINALDINEDLKRILKLMAGGKDER